MGELAIDVLHWLPVQDVDPVERETLASLRITVGGADITEVEDLIGRSVRPHVNLSAYSLARWLIVNWWRLRWEPERNDPTLDWLQSHSLAAIGGGFAWPPLIVSSDGEFVRLRTQDEARADVSAVRYLNRANVEVPARDFERAVDGFLDSVEARLAATLPGERELMELREELGQERADPQRASTCRLEAMAGYDPGDSPEALRKALAEVAALAGRVGAEEVAAIVPELPEGMETAKSILSTLRRSPVSATLGWVAQFRAAESSVARPWQRGELLAASVRAGLNLPPGPISNAQVNELMEISLPLQKTSCPGVSNLRGGLRQDGSGGRTHLLVHSDRLDSQRFQLARLIGASIAAGDEERLLPVTSGLTAFQKFERSFAREFLCPWRDLKAYIDEHGTDDDGIADAAEHFAVSEMLVLSTLVNKGEIPRYRLGA